MDSRADIKQMVHDLTDPNVLAADEAHQALFAAAARMREELTIKPSYTWDFVIGGRHILQSVVDSDDKCTAEVLTDTENMSPGDGAILAMSIIAWLTRHDWLGTDATDRLHVEHIMDQLSLVYVDAPDCPF